MNNQTRRRVQIIQEHYLYQSNQLLEDNDHTSFDDVNYTYDTNTQIATVRCFWQHIVSSTVGANLVNICYPEAENGLETEDFVNVMDRHSDGTPVTVGYLAGLGTYDVNDEHPDFFLHLNFKYVMGNVVDEPHCICNL